MDGGPLSPLSEAYLTTHPQGMHTIVYFDGPLDVDCMSQSVDLALAEYPSLASPLSQIRTKGRYFLVRQRSNIRQPLQLVSCPPAPHRTDAFERIQDWMRRESRPFDLFREPPARLTLLKFSETDHALDINTHHTCADGFVLLRLIQSILTHYHRIQTGEEIQSEASPGSSITAKANWTAGARRMFQEVLLRKRHALIKRPAGRPGSSRPVFERLVLNPEVIRKIAANAKSFGVTVNDWLNVAAVRSIDKLRQNPEGLMSVCLPVDLRRYATRSGGRHGNLTSGFYLHFEKSLREDHRRLLQAFAQRRKRLLDEGRAAFNMMMLQGLYRPLRYMSYERRSSFLQRWGYYPTTFFCSNLGVIRLPRETFGHGLNIRNADVFVSPNRSADYSLVAWTYHDELRIFISADENIVPPGEIKEFVALLDQALSS